MNNSSNPELSTRSLLANSDANIATKAAARYLFPNNAHNSVRRHKRIGTPILRKAVMRTARHPRYLSNYTMDARKGRMERSAEYATKQSVFNEVFHTVCLAQNIPVLFAELQNGSIDNPTMIKFWFALNLGAIAVQRFNRARIVQFLDKRLEKGKHFDDSYENWLHLDNRSVSPTAVDGNSADGLTLGDTLLEKVEPADDYEVSFDSEA